MSRAHHRRRWRALRQVILARDGYRCTICGAAGRLEIDHRVPVSAFPKDQRGERPGMADHPDNLRALCRSCHVEITRAQFGAPQDPDWQNLLREHAS